jgi:hypothetical protein
MLRFDAKVAPQAAQSSSGRSGCALLTWFMSFLKRLPQCWQRLVAPPVLPPLRTRLLKAAIRNLISQLPTWGALEGQAITHQGSLQTVCFSYAEVLEF